MNRYKFIDEGRKHLHTLDGKSLIGCSTVVGVIGKGAALSWWSSGKACETLGWIKKEYAPEDKYKKNCLNEDHRLQSAFNSLDKLQNIRADEYLGLLDTAYKAHSVRLKEAATAGVDLHSELEKFVKSQITGEDYAIPPDAIVQLMPFINWSKINVKRWLFSELHVYSERLWTGGIIDAGYIDMNDQFVLADFKSGGAWLSGYIQLGGYSKQLMENRAGFNKDGDKIFECREIPVREPTLPDSLAIFSFKGDFKEPIIISGQTHKYMDAFEHALKLYKLQQEFQKL